MHAAKRAFLMIERYIGLSDYRLQSVCLELMLTEGAGEVTARVFPPLNVYCESTFQLGFCKDHRK
jgi:hypothetical protein